MIIDSIHWTRVLKRCTYLIIGIISIFIAFKLAVFYMPFLIAFVISMIIEPAIKILMNKIHLTRKTSSVIILIVVFGIIIGVMIWGITTIISEATGLLLSINQYYDNILEQVIGLIEKIKLDSLNIPNEIVSIIQNSASEVLNYIANWIKTTLTSIVNFFTAIPTIGIYFFITTIALYFICTDKIYILDQLEHHLPRKWSKKLLMHIKEISTTLSLYLKAQATLIIITFIISVIGLYLFKCIGLDIKYPFIIAIGIGFVDALPILGSGTAMIPWAFFTALNGDIKLAIGISILWIVMSVTRQFIEPKIVSNQIGIHPIFTLIAMYTGFKFIGVFGLIIGPIVLIILDNIFSNLIDKGIVKTIVDKK